MACLFCDIVSGGAEAVRVWETEHCLAFLDARPVFKGHTLLVPKSHIDTFVELPAGQRDHYFAVGQQLALAMRTGLAAQGSFVAMNNTVSQSVPHLHLHVVPRTKGDGLRGFFWPRTTYADGEAQGYADRLRTSMEGR